MVSHYPEHICAWCPTLLNIFIHGLPLFWTYINIVPLFWTNTHGVPLFWTYIYMMSRYSEHIYMVTHYSEHTYTTCPTILNKYIHGVPLFWTYIYIYMVSHYSEHIYIQGVTLFWTYIDDVPLFWTYIYRVSNYPAPPWYKKCILLTDVVNFAWDTLQHVIVKAIIVRLVRLHKYKGPSRSLEYMYYNLILVCQEITRGQKNIKNILCKI